MKKTESFCTACEWKGEGTGLVGCPICGQPITTLDVEEENSNHESPEYPEEILNKTESPDEF